MAEFLNALSTPHLAVAALAAFGAFCIWGLVGLIFGRLFTTTVDVLNEAGPQHNSSQQLEQFIMRTGHAYGALAELWPGQSQRFERLMVVAGRPLGGVDGRQFNATVIAVGAALSALVTLVLTGAKSAGLTPDASYSGIALTALLTFAFLQLAAWWHLKTLAQSVTEEIMVCFPFYLDLAVLTIQAGSLPKDTFQHYIDAAPHTKLSREFQIVLRETEALSIDEALIRMSERVDAMPVRSILRNLSQAQRTSGKLSAFYAEQAVELRQLRKDITERTIERMRVNLKVPEFLLFAAIALAIVAPALNQVDLF